MATPVKKPVPTPVEEGIIEEEVPVFKKPDFYTVRVPKTREDKEDKVVWVNDMRYVIRKGENVTVPRAVYEILCHEEEMLSIIDAFETEQENKHKR